MLFDTEGRGAREASVLSRHKVDLTSYYGTCPESECERLARDTPGHTYLLLLFTYRPTMATLAAKPPYSVLYEQQRWRWHEWYNIEIDFNVNGQGRVSRLKQMS